MLGELHIEIIKYYGWRKNERYVYKEVSWDMWIWRIPTCVVLYIHKCIVIPLNFKYFWIINVSLDKIFVDIIRIGVKLVYFWEMYIFIINTWIIQRDLTIWDIRWAWLFQRTQTHFGESFFYTCLLIGKYFLRSLGEVIIVINVIWTITRLSHGHFSISYDGSYFFLDLVRSLIKLIIQIILLLLEHLILQKCLGQLLIAKGFLDLLLLTQFIWDFSATDIVNHTSDIYFILKFIHVLNLFGSTLLGLLHRFT